MDMNKNQKILLIASLLAVLILMAVASKIEPKHITPIANITNASIGKAVIIEGMIKSAREFSNKTFFLLEVSDETGSITVTAKTRFASSLKESINYSKAYLVKGKVEDYNQTLEISADLIKPAP